MNGNGATFRFRRILRLLRCIGRVVEVGAWPPAIDAFYRASLACRHVFATARQGICVFTPWTGQHVAGEVCRPPARDWVEVIGGMTEEVLPAALVAFIRRAVSSIWALDLLLFLKVNRASAWSVAQLVRELRSSGPLVLDVLISLHRSGLVEKVGEDYRYVPASDELSENVELLERLSTERPLAVRNAILAAPHDKIQVFADAFRIKRD